MFLNVFWLNEKLKIILKNIVNNKKRNNINKRNNIINIEYYFKMVLNFSFSQKTFICHLQFLKRKGKNGKILK